MSLKILFIGVLKPVSFNKNKYWLQMEDLEKKYTQSIFSLYINLLAFGLNEILKSTHVSLVCVFKLHLNAFFLYCTDLDYCFNVLLDRAVIENT